MTQWKIYFNALIYICLIPILIQKPNKISPELKEKAKTCLILYRLRQHQDSKTMNAIFEQLSSIENAKEKLSMFGITHCYAVITSDQVEVFQKDLENKKSINTLSEEYVQLLSLENIGNIDFNTFSDSISEFYEVFNELMLESKEEAKKQETSFTNEPEPMEEEKSFYETNIFVIIAIVFVVNMCFVIYQCMKVGKKKKTNNNSNKTDSAFITNKSNSKDNYNKSCNEEDKSDKEGKTTKAE